MDGDGIRWFGRLFIAAQVIYYFFFSCWRHHISQLPGKKEDNFLAAVKKCSLSYIYSLGLDINHVGLLVAARPWEYCY
jgi:hypothetical protein